MDDASRVATERVGPDIFQTTKAATQYHLGDHLGSSNVVIDDQGSLINREEYRPYGETSFGSYAKKRYRFTGKERDEESGLYYHGARYYAPWLSRWTAADPAGMVDGPNLYAYVRGNPVRLVDPDGRESRDKEWYFRYPQHRISFLGQEKEFLPGVPQSLDEVDPSSQTIFDLRAGQKFSEMEPGETETIPLEILHGIKAVALDQDNLPLSDGTLVYPIPDYS